jgi:hypothetical protein
MTTPYGFSPNADWLPFSIFSCRRPASFANDKQLSTSRRRGSSRLGCICVDCGRVTNCKGYHFVESKHEQPHMTADPSFTPRQGSPTIHVNVRTFRDKDNDAGEVERLWKEQQFVEQTSSNVYNSATTVEYDVVRCEDFVPDKGCWIRNMPDEIRRANPDFVPS